MGVAYSLVTFWGCPASWRELPLECCAAELLSCFGFPGLQKHRALEPTEPCGVAALGQTPPGPACGGGVLLAAGGAQVGGVTLGCLADRV